MNYLFHPSTLILLLANLFAIYQVWASGWSVYVVLLVYVIQGIIIGILHYIKILGLKQFTAKDWANGISVVENGKKVDIESRGA
ncbi:MAG: DUF6498-containing protein, partial [Candidatus Diapherotrites archaeon]|nr:DUF6498-containing protein [Candidatus Diapherotrites archaeon]